MAIWVVCGEELAALALDAGAGGSHALCFGYEGWCQAWQQLDQFVFRYLHMDQVMSHRSERELCKQKQFPLCTWSTVPLFP